MAIDKKTPYGGINIGKEAIAKVAGDAAIECYGVVGLTSRGLSDKVLPKESYTESVIAKKTKKGFEVDIYLIVAYEVKITEVVHEVQKKVRYVLERTFGLKFKAINVYVQGLGNLPERL